jgi:hypothetical protein
MREKYYEKLAENIPSIFIKSINQEESYVAKPQRGKTGWQAVTSGREKGYLSM